MENMREILCRQKVKTGRPSLLKIPWLRTEEAAAYCGMSLAAFKSYAGVLPCGGDADVKLFHVDHLDRWIEYLLDFPFPHIAVSKPRQMVFRQEVNDLRELDQVED